MKLTPDQQAKLDDPDLLQRLRQQVKHWRHSLPWWSYEDLLQEALLVAARCCAIHDGKRPITNLVMHAVRNRMITLLKAQQPSLSYLHNTPDLPQASHLQEVEDHRHAPPGHLLQAQEIMQKAQTMLTPLEWGMVYRRTILGESYRIIGQAFGRSRARVEQIVCEALQRLRQELEPSELTPC